MTGDIGADRDGYQGPARLRVGHEQYEVVVELRGFFQPIDGRFHWYGRILGNEKLAQALGGKRAEGVLVTGQGPASPCELSEPDLWGRYRVSGVSTPPFGVAVRSEPTE